MMSERDYNIYDLCVVGAGLVGSSAAKYASKLLSEGKPQSVNHKICLIGPDEPKTREESDIQGAHYDVARICRRSAGDIRWGIVTSRSILRFRDIEAESGLNFYGEVGCLMAGDPKETEYISHVHKAAVLQGLTKAHLLDSQKLSQHFPYLGLPSQCIGLWESGEAGYLDPRKLVQAQQKLAQKYGCELIKDIVSSVKPLSKEEISKLSLPSGDGKVMKVQTDTGRVLYARKVLLATNAFTEGFRDLLPAGVHLDMMPASQAVIYVELSPQDLAKLARMPSMLIKVPGVPVPVTDEPFLEAYDVYILPPVKYPNGKTYLKLGHGATIYQNPLSPREVVSWYRSPVPKDIIDGLKKLFHTLFPDIVPVSVSTDTCATVNTVTERPFISFLPGDDCLAVSVGGCGAAAKCCDELGRLAAQLVLRGWDDKELKQEDFQVKLIPAPKSRL